MTSVSAGHIKLTPTQQVWKSAMNDFKKLSNRVVNTSRIDKKKIVYKFW